MHEQVSFPPLSMLKVKWDDFPCFHFPWHFHSEYEIVYVLRSSGKRFVADCVESFQEGDITLMGSNLPHLWKSENVEDDQKIYRVNAIVVQFHKDFFREAIHSYPEFHRINDLLERAGRGINFTAPINERLGKMLKRLIKLSGLERMLYFIKLLNIMAQTDNYRILASSAYPLEAPKELNNRLDKIIHFINTNYQRKITQGEIASNIGMNTAAFCRYFKEKTGKSFIYYVNEIRIGYACRLLTEYHLSISQICYECGFNNISNFNRMFKRQTGATPGEYRLQFIKT